MCRTVEGYKSHVASQFKISHSSLLRLVVMSHLSSSTVHKGSAHFYDSCSSTLPYGLVRSPNNSHCWKQLWQGGTTDRTILPLDMCRTVEGTTDLWEICAWNSHWAAQHAKDLLQMGTTLLVWWTEAQQGSNCTTALIASPKRRWCLSKLNHDFGRNMCQSIWTWTHRTNHRSGIMKTLYWELMAIMLLIYLADQCI